MYRDSCADLCRPAGAQALGRVRESATASAHRGAWYAAAACSVGRTGEKRGIRLPDPCGVRCIAGQMATASRRDM